jgi:type I restriction enzyme S subunit
MTSALHPYPNTKESGVPWLERVPAHWELVPLGRIGRFSKGSGGTKEDEVADGVPCIRYGDLYSKYDSFITEPRSFVAPDRVAVYTPVQFGDVLFAGSGETIDEIGKSAVNLIEGDVVCGGDVLVFRPNREVDPRFLGYAADCRSSIHQKARMGRGITVMHIYADELKYLYIALPPLSEQAAIVRFLDHADRRIRRAIRAKQKLISLLNEQKQAVIHRAVTRGLDPNVRLKPSGVEWLGDVPEHWDVRRLKTLASIGTGGRDTVDRVDGGAYPFFVRSQKVESIDTYSFDGEAVLTAGDGAGVAKVFHHVNGKFDYHQRVYRFSDFRQMTGRFFYHYFSSSLRYEAFRETAKSTVDSLRLPMLQSFPVVVPPVEEQDLIVRFIEREISMLDRSLTMINREVKLLVEFRARLVADVVAGKLDVREAATRLRHESNEPEPLDEIEVEQSDESEAEDLEAVEA